MALTTRPPTGRVVDPFILLEGEDKAGKSRTPALFAENSKRIGQMYWIDLNEGAADEYGDPDNPRWLVVEHDGSYAQVMEAIIEIKAIAQAARNNGEPPVVLVIDTFSAVWEGLKDWVTERAMKSKSNRAARQQDPDAEVRIPRQFWNDANARYRKMLTQLLTFPGIVIATSRGKAVSDTDPSTGQPYRDGRKTWKVEGQSNMAFDASHVIRLTRSAPPLVVGSRSKSKELSIQPGVDDPVTINGHRDDLLDWFIFEALHYDPVTAHSRKLADFHGGDLTEDERDADDADEPIRVTRHPKASEISEAIAAAVALPIEKRIEGLHDVWELYGQDLLNKVPVSAPDGTLMPATQVIAGWKVEIERQLAAQAPAKPEPHNLLMDEIMGHASTLGAPPAEYVKPLLEQHEGAKVVKDVPAPAVLAWVAAQRPAVAAALREQGQSTAAQALEGFPAAVWGTWEVVTSPREDATEQVPHTANA